ncbi:arabinan endo-1,5-alpha-L-arabinosidase [Hephaestia caeni]|uniref:Extracellular exo-alpha-(1->5)-L-arabinofuranosidase n=1 Tax=Hephaestia caeni TaxID=645617 RepID=A0A397NND8_9SPHN|nr:arabinan endo-1,5-alpha-L-arabinosidase [Hephaestia caeni]RIA37113.1 arabinan endo-1,5-alpha-L-arabinosidase [Hephaestia caeni]
MTRIDPAAIGRRGFVLASLAAGACAAAGVRPSGSVGGSGNFADRLTGAISPVHDPCIIRQGDTYHLFCTGHVGEGAGVLPWRVSTDLIHWSAHGSVFDGLPGWAQDEVPGTRGIWAPDISYSDGRYHLYYSLSTFGKNRSAIALVTTPTLDTADPAFGWRDEGVVLRSTPQDDYNAIDANHVVDAEGRVWLAFGSFWGGLQIVPLDPATGKPPAGAKPRTIARRPMPDAIEAPFIIRRGDFYYLFASFDFCCRGANSTYYTVVGRAAKADGPYVDREGRSMLKGGGMVILRADRSAGDRFVGPGHCAVLQDSDRDYIVYHAYDTQRDGVPTLRIHPLDWSTDGWPTVV